FTIIDVATGLAAMVFGDDGVSAYPSTVVSGGTVTDASGAVYIFDAGKYRFPFMPLGDYRLEITPPSGYSYPSQVPTADIQAIPTGPFSIVTGSRGETFKIQAGPALHIDIPLDGKGVNLFVRKTATTATAGIGDRVGYQISVENVHITSASTASIVHDTLPLGFRYQTGSANLDGIALADPTISANGRDLSFNIGTIAAAPTIANLTYTAVVGANTRLGLATNSAFATGTMAAVAVSSNISKANVTIREDLIRSRGFIAGVVFIDENMNEIQDKGELGVEGIRIFMQDGRSIVTDKNGRYHFDAVKLGTHVVQMDRATIKNKYQAIGLKQTRFSKNDYSQFVEVTGGGLARANFRLINRAPEETPVLVKHVLSEGEGEQKGLVLADVEVSQSGQVELSELQAFYNLPKGWKYVLGSATLNGVQVEPEPSPVGLVWQLGAKEGKHHIRLAMRGSGEGALKEASAYARFVSSGSQQGRTGLATIKIQDTLKELHDQRSFTLHLKFASRKAEAPEQELGKLKELIHSLNGLVVRELIVEGHTDDIPIAKRNQKEFKNNLVLSQARANYIAAYLKEHLQLDEGIVFAVGKGEQEPIASNQTRKGRKQNRRVVLKVRADKITHDFSTQLQDTQAQGQGVALGSWDMAEVVAVKAPEVKKTEGILSPVDGMSLPHPIASVRIALPSSLS
ncbi:MAG: OmpA family protein, partial [Ghiorsea sp.]|nr:OmpA family protein [Ghiorsea sp.]